jgi:DNA primase catalytic core
MISKETIDKIRDAANIVDVVGEFVTLRKAGINYKGLCPFHDDKNPSMVVSPSRGTYHCFVCGKHGDAISFLQEHENMSFVEALRFLAKKYNIELDEQQATPEEEARYKKRESQLIAIEAAAKFFQSQLQEARTFLTQRGYGDPNERALSDYGVGYAPAANALLAFMRQKGYSEDVLVEVGVLSRADDGRTFDTFRDRLMFPFFDLHGRVIGFSGRQVTPNERSGKYVNTGETPLFHKGRNLFGLFQARHAIGRKDFAYLVEGQFDVMSLHRCGVENVIGGSGTAFTDDQVRLIVRFTQRVVMIYDADAAGIKAAVKNCLLLLKAGVQVKCVRLPKGQDPDDFAREHGSKTADKLQELTEAFPYAFRRLLVPRGCKDETAIADALNTIVEMIAAVGDAALRLEYLKSVAKDFNTRMGIIEKKVLALRNSLPESVGPTMQNGIYGLDTLKQHLEEDRPAIVTSQLQDFIDRLDDEPIVLSVGRPDETDILRLRSAYGYFTTQDTGCHISDDGTPSDYLATLADMYRLGIQKLYVVSGDVTESFIDFYISIWGKFLKSYLGADRVDHVRQCIELTSYADDAVVTVNRNRYCSQLGLTKGQFDDLRKPFVAARKSALRVTMQSDALDNTEFDANEPPAYVRDNEDYWEMWKQYGYFPRLNKQGEPVCYVFRNKNGNGVTQVADFYITPLLHIFNEDFEQNKRILRISRRYYETPIYIEVVSKALQKMSTIEDVLINYEAVNFSNGEDWQWRRIKEWMSRRYTLCSEIMVYGNQQTEGTSRRQDEQFFAFSNGIAHMIGNQMVFESINEMGVVTHNNRNYYLPAFSTIYAGGGRRADKYELISQLTYREVPKEKQIDFTEWARLMNEVYKINDNGKWATVFAVMSAFRSNIHCIDRLFTAPFFMGPMSSGKTQIAVSIRSLFVSPHESIFNLNLGTDAAMISYMSSFRDVPVILDEYNNNDISPTKFQALKSIVYDGDSKQKRKANSSREIESDKVFAPVIICGQETPQRDDNALMSRVIICEVPKPKDRTPEESRLFEHLKEIEDPSKVGLSNVLLRVLQLRPLVMDHFRPLRQKAYEELKRGRVIAGETDRLMKTVSLFLGMVKLIEQYAPDMRLPFTYQEFFKIAEEKITDQQLTISSTDKLAIFFTAVNILIDTKKVVEGRDFVITEADNVTVRNVTGDRQNIVFGQNKNIMFIRVQPVFAIFEQAGLNKDGTTQSTIDQNLRSSPCYIGRVYSRRFNWEEIQLTSDPYGNVQNRTAYRTTVSSAIVLDYDRFVEMYDIDYRRAEQSQSTAPEASASGAQPSAPVLASSGASVQQELPFSAPDTNINKEEADYTDGKPFL